MNLTKRHRFVPQIENLETREVPAVSIKTIGSTLLIRGDNNANQIRIYDYGSTVSVQADDRRVARFGIRDIRVEANGGNDNVKYFLRSNIRQNRSFSADLGYGSDRFVGYVQGDIQRGRMSMVVDGDSGNDRMIIMADYAPGGATRGVDVSRGATLQMKLDGQNGHDRLSTVYKGEMDGFVDLYSRGGKNFLFEKFNKQDTDTVYAKVQAESGSTGKVRSVVKGGKEADTLTNLVYIPRGAFSDSVVDGEQGGDTCFRTAGTVRQRHCKFDFVMP